MWHIALKDFIDYNVAYKLMLYLRGIMRKIIIVVICCFLVIANSVIAATIPKNKDQNLRAVTALIQELKEKEMVIANETDSRLASIEAKIEEKNSGIQLKIAELDEKLKFVEQSMAQFKRTVLINENDVWYGLGLLRRHADRVIADMGGYPQYTLWYMGGSILVGLILIYLLLRFFSSCRRHCKAVSGQKEYDFMAGEDGIVTKLNLARTYINMDKKAEAQIILHEVLTNGSQAEQEEARELLEKI